MDPKFLRNMVDGLHDPKGFKSDLDLELWQRVLCVFLIRSGFISFFTGPLDTCSEIRVHFKRSNRKLFFADFP